MDSPPVLRSPGRCTTAARIQQLPMRFTRRSARVRSAVGCVRSRIRMCRNSYCRRSSSTHPLPASDYRGESTGTSTTRRDNMQIFRYADGDEARIGVMNDDGRRWRLPVRALAELLQLSLAELRSLVEAGGESI